MLVTLFVIVSFTSIAFAGKSQARRHIPASLTSVHLNLFEKGTRLVEKQELDKAAEIFELILARGPLYFDSYFYLANIYHRMGRYQEAIAVLEKARKFCDIKLKTLSRRSLRNPHFSQFYYMLGTSYLKTNRLGKAAEALELVLKSHNYKTPHTYWVRTHTSGPQQIKSFYASVHLNLGTAYAGMGADESAMKHYKKLKKLDKEQSERLLKLIKQ